MDRCYFSLRYRLVMTPKLVLFLLLVGLTSRVIFSGIINVYQGPVNIGNYYTYYKVKRVQNYSLQLESDYHDHIEHEHHESLQPINFFACRRNEVWYDCLPDCPITCSNLYRKCAITSGRCYMGWDCKRGYARLIEHGPCVNVRNCPGKNAS